MEYTYNTMGTCSRQIRIDVADGVIQSLSFLGGCHGNLQGIAALAKGKTLAEVADALEGIHCGNKPTSCPDQLAKALRAIMAQEK